MQVLAINPRGAFFHLHVNAIENPLLKARYGEYSVNFWRSPAVHQASDELVTRAVINLMASADYSDWKFQIL